MLIYIYFCLRYYESVYYWQAWESCPRPRIVYPPQVGAARSDALEPYSINSDYCRHGQLIEHIFDSTYKANPAVCIIRVAY